MRWVSTVGNLLLFTTTKQRSKIAFIVYETLHEEKAVHCLMFHFHDMTREFPYKKQMSSFTGC
jgi:hypothetical protein